VVVIVILALHIPQDRKWGLARDALSCCLAVEDKCPAGMVLSCRTDARSSLYRAISCSCPHTKINHQREDPDSHFLQNYSTKPREPSNASQCQKYVLDTDERDLQLPSFLIVSCATFFAVMGIE
jgi:hypothetical protein